MASEKTYSLSPPLPPDPSPKIPAQTKTPRFEEPYAAAQQKEPSERDPPLRQPQPDQRREESSRVGTAQPVLPPALQQPQPIKDAVNNAFEHAPVANQIDPDFIKQVTEQVIKNLQAAGATSAPPPAPAPSTQPQQTRYAPPPPPPAPLQQQQAPIVAVPRSPTQSSMDSIPQQFTPPTPERRQRDIRDDRDYGSSSPEHPPSDSGSSFSRGSRGSVRSNASQRSGDTPRPYNTDTSSKSRRRSYTTGTRRDAGREESGQGLNGSGFDASAREKTPFRRESRDSQSSYEEVSRSRVRPRAPSEIEETTLERIWQPLFDNGNPTMRLSQFLRGLAQHLVDDFEPKSSLVVTPAKMLRFFNETKVEQEHYPWDTIFGGKMTVASISMTYRKLLCQHHLVQTQNHELPSVPGLTPQGFEWLMTCLIQAHPDTEFERLAKAVMNMPISNADNKAERFPKELSRRLLPAEGNIQAEQRLVSSLNHEPYLVGNLKGSMSMPPPPASAPPPPMPFAERERKPYSQSSQYSNAIDDDDLGQPAIPIERERKPYTGKEGAGKVYGSEDSRPGISQYKPDVGARTARTNSGLPLSGGYGTSAGQSDPVNIPPRNVHRMSTGQGQPPTFNGGYPKPGRGRSSPPRNPYAQSEAFDVGSIPNTQNGSNLRPPNLREQYAGEPDEDQRKRYQSRSRNDRPTTANKPNDEDTNNGRGYPIPSRGIPIGNSYEYGSGSAGGTQQQGPVPVGSYPSRRPMGADDRRRSMYVSPSDGGTDGYGSFAGSNGGPGYPPQSTYGSSVQH